MISGMRNVGIVCCCNNYYEHAHPDADSSSSTNAMLTELCSPRPYAVSCFPRLRLL